MNKVSEERNEFLHLVRSNEDMGNDYIIEFTAFTRLSSLYAKRVAAISATWFTTSGGKTVASGRAFLISSVDASRRN
jgi:hypothetical protein